MRKNGALVWIRELFGFGSRNSASKKPTNGDFLHHFVTKQNVPDHLRLRYEARER
jgi:hypothetical protein